MGLSDQVSKPWNEEEAGEALAEQVPGVLMKRGALQRAAWQVYFHSTPARLLAVKVCSLLGWSGFKLNFCVLGQLCTHAKLKEIIQPNNLYPVCPRANLDKTQSRITARSWRRDSQNRTCPLPPQQSQDLLSPNTLLYPTPDPGH